MQFARGLSASAFGLAIILVAGCSTAPPAPPPPPPPALVPLGLGAPYLTGDIIGGRHSRAAKIKAARIAPLSPAAAIAYIAREETELRHSTAGIGVDVIRLADGLLVRIPAALTFNSDSADINPQFDATLNEIARTLKAEKQTYVDVIGHTDTTGDAKYNESLSEKRARAVAAYLSRHGVVRARLATRGLGESAPLYSPDITETQQAANRRVEIRIVPFRSTDLRR